jgi:antitoxin CcdA
LRINYPYNKVIIFYDSFRISDRPLKKATNLTLTSEVLEVAKKLGVNISKVCDAFIESLVKPEKERRWKLDNAVFISAYNQITADEGLPLDQWRSF